MQSCYSGEDLVLQARQASVKVVPQVGNIEAAEKAANMGVDAIMVQALEAGGHVIVQGFATEESYAHPIYKRKLVDLDKTEGTDVFGHARWPGAPHRVLKTPFFTEWKNLPSHENESNQPVIGYSIIHSTVEHEFSVVGQKLENVTVFEELRLDDLDPLKYGFVNGEELQSLPGSSMNLGNDAGIVDGFNSSVTFGLEEVIFNTLDANQLTTVCVWCRTEFKLDSGESETPSDSIGYMSLTCKNKISGHLDGGLSIDPHGF